jgi:hypothetical protein
MAFQDKSLLQITLEAAGDLSAAQYKFVKLDGNGRVAVCNAATDLPLGVLQNKPAALGRAADVLMVGVSKVQADAAIAAGVLIGTSADGQADAKTVGTDTTEYVVGRTLQASTAAAQLIACSINCLNPHRAA